MATVRGLLHLFLAQRGILSATPLNMKRGKRKAGEASAAAGSGAQRALVDVRGVGQQIVVQFDPGKAANGKKGKKATQPKFWVVDSDVRKQHGLGSGTFSLGAGAAFDLAEAATRIARAAASSASGMSDRAQTVRSASSSPRRKRTCAAEQQDCQGMPPLEQHQHSDPSDSGGDGGGFYGSDSSGSGDDGDDGIYEPHHRVAKELVRASATPPITSTTGSGGSSSSTTSSTSTSTNSHPTQVGLGEMFSNYQSTLPRTSGSPQVPRNRPSLMIPSYLAVCAPI